MNVTFQPTANAPLTPQTQGVAQGSIQANVPNCFGFGQGADCGAELAGALTKSAFEVMPQLQAAQQAKLQQADTQRAAMEAQRATVESQHVLDEAEQARALQEIDNLLEDANRLAPRAETLGPVDRDLELARRLQKGIDAAVESKVRSDDPTIQAARQTMYQALISAQMKAQSMGLSLEAASKVVESATSGVRTVLQTQT